MSRAGLGSLDTSGVWPVEQGRNEPSPFSPPAGSPECSGISGYSSHISPEEKEGRELGGPEAGGSKPTWPPRRANSSPTLPRRPSR